jgi:hypothetical protein
MSRYEAVCALQEHQDTAVEKIKRFAWVDGTWMPDPDGGWVLFNEVKTRFNDEVKKAVQKSAVLPDAIANARNEGVAYATQKFEEERAAVKAERTRTNALLNELYHDRARLEKVVQDAVCVVCTLEGVINGDPIERLDGTAHLSAREAREWAIGLSQQFIDTHDDGT